MTHFAHFDKMINIYAYFKKNPHICTYFEHIFHSQIITAYVFLFQDQYAKRFPKSAKPVVLNDVVFAVNVMISTFIILIQCMIYERGDQKVSKVAKIFLFCCNTLTSSISILIYFKVLQWLDFIYVCSYIKLAITFKYIPQVCVHPL